MDTSEIIDALKAELSDRDNQIAALQTQLTEQTSNATVSSGRVSELEAIIASGSGAIKDENARLNTIIETIRTAIANA